MKLFEKRISKRYKMSCVQEHNYVKRELVVTFAYYFLGMMMFRKDKVFNKSILPMSYHEENIASN